MSKADRFFRRAERLLKRIEDMLPNERDTVNLEEGVAWRWRTGGSNTRLEPITRFNQITLEDLLHVERQKDALVRNTEQFLAGVPANNALLWGPRGTGKSSLVKALLNDFSAQGLRLVEVDRLDRSTYRRSLITLKIPSTATSFIAMIFRLTKMTRPTVR